MLDEDLKRNKQGWQGFTLPVLNANHTWSYSELVRTLWILMVNFLVSETKPENKCEYTVFEKTVLIGKDEHFL